MTSIEQAKSRIFQASCLENALTAYRLALVEGFVGRYTIDQVVMAQYAIQRCKDQLHRELRDLGMGLLATDLLRYSQDFLAESLKGKEAPE